MKPRIVKTLCGLTAFCMLLTVSGVYAAWRYFNPPKAVEQDFPLGVGDFTYEAGQILHIRNAEEYASNNLTSELNYEYSLPTSLKVWGEVARSNSSVTYKVTVFNNTDLTYWYIGQKIPSYGTNALLSSNDITVLTKDHALDDINTFNSYDWIPARTERDFYVTYTFATNASVGDIELFIDFYFAIRLDGVQDEFLAILNDKETANGYNYLSGVFNQGYSQNGSNVIDSVTHADVFENLFGGNLTIDVDGVETPVTVSIQRKNVDGTSDGDDYPGANAPKGCEYTVYVTTDTLTAGGKPTVYAITYSCGEDGVWYQIGELYEGVTNVTNTALGAVMSVDSWIAKPNTYKVYEGIEYKVGQQYGTNYDLLKTIEEIMSTDDSEIFNKVDNSGLFKRVYDILNLPENKNSDLPEVVNLRRAFESAAPYYDIRNGGQEIKVNRNCKRGEILPYLTKICDALEYYQAVHE